MFKHKDEKKKLKVADHSKNTISEAFGIEWTPNETTMKVLLSKKAEITEFVDNDTDFTLSRKERLALAITFTVEFDIVVKTLVSMATGTDYETISSVVEEVYYSDITNGDLAVCCMKATTNGGSALAKLISAIAED